MAEKIYFGKGEGIKKFKNMTEKEKKNYIEAIKEGKIKCKSCGCDLIIAAFGPHENEEKGGFKVHTYVKAKNRHFPDFPCYDSASRTNTRINTSSKEESDSMKNALQRKIKEMAKGDGDGGAVENESTSRKIKWSGGGDSKTTKKNIKRVIQLPRTIDKMRVERKYVYYGEMSIKISGEKENGYRNVELTPVDVSEWLTIKLRAGKSTSAGILYDDLIKNRKKYNNQTAVFCFVIYVNKDLTSEKRFLFWPEETSWIEIEKIIL